MTRIGCYIAAAIVAAPMPALARMAPPIEVSASPAPNVAQVVPATPSLKRKVAIGRFSNSTRYGKALLLDGEADPLANQASDMLASRLVDSGQFMVFERGDLGAIDKELASTSGNQAGLVGVDTLIVGSVTEFGRKIEGKSGFLNSKTRQIASATVEVRLVDVRTGQAFFSTSGTGSASVEAGEVAGFGGVAGYDSTLNDKAISAAISDLTTNVMQKLQGRRWYTDVLQVRGDQAYISGGAAQGLRIGDSYLVERRGEVVTSGQTGLPISLPGQVIGRLEIVSFFGDDASTEGAVARIVQGQIEPSEIKFLRVIEAR